MLQFPYPPSEATDTIVTFGDEVGAPLSKQAFTYLNNDVAVAVPIVVSMEPNVTFDGNGGLFQSQGGTAFSLGTGNAVRDMQLASAGEVDQLISFQASATGAVIDSITLDGTAATTFGFGIQANQPIYDTRVSNLLINAYGYGVLINTNSGGMDQFIISGTIINAEIGDGLCYNHPSTAGTNLLSYGLIMSTTGGSSVNSGFGLSHAHSQGFVSSAFIIAQSRAEAVHIEDGCAYGVLSGFVATATTGDGIRHLYGGGGDNQAESTPLVVTSFALQGEGVSTGKTAIYPVWDTDGVQDRSPYVAGYADNYEFGFFAGGDGAYHIADDISFTRVTSLLRHQNGGANTRHTRQRGEIVGYDCTNFVVSDGANTGSGDFGKFADAHSPPDYIIRRMTTTAKPGVKVSGFAFKLPDCVHTGGGADEFFNICRAPVAMKGRITIFMRDGNTTTGSFWEADVIYDATTALAISGIIKDQNGGIIIGTTQLRINGGYLQLGLFASSARTGKVQVSFDGTYYTS